MNIFKKNEKIGAYTVQFFIKAGVYAHYYRVKDSSGKLYFLKLIDCSKLDQTQLDGMGNVIELDICKNASHPNLSKYIESKVLLIQNKKYVFLVFDYIVGETVSERIARKQECSVYDSKQIILGVLNGLKFLHGLAKPIIHNDISIQNIMIDMKSEMLVSKIIDFGYSRFLDQGSIKINTQNATPFHIAPELFKGEYSPQSDIFSVGVMLYHLLFGLPPWFLAISSCDHDNIQDAISKTRLHPLRIPNVDKFELDENLINIVKKSTYLDRNDRFSNIDEFIEALSGKTVIEIKSMDKPAPMCIPKKSGNGFSDIAGMHELKEQLKFDVIELLQNPEEYKKHNLHLPNGILLYGPPGCGKTFFAEKFAEETGYNFIKVVTSDIASIYVHGTQEKIRKIFDEARQKAPTILYFDEINSMVPSRDSGFLQNGAAGEVNEFLSQLDNCGEKGIFVIASTNYPNQIDLAVMRAGRLEQKFYVSPPDYAARKEMFMLYLKSRPIDTDIDYDELSKISANLVSADIKLLVDKASRLTIRNKLDVITMETLRYIILNSKPTVSIEDINKYEQFKNKF